MVANCLMSVLLQIIQCRHKKAVLGSLGSSEDIETVLDDLLVAGVDLELYKSFKKEFLYDWLKNADKHTLLEFDRMSVMLRNYLGDDSYLSFLSLETVARFWRKLVKGFPEVRKSLQKLFVVQLLVLPACSGAIRVNGTPGKSTAVGI